MCLPLAAQTTQSIYTDSLQNGWENWGWAAIDYQNAQPVHSGAKSIAVTFTDNSWQGIYFHHEPFDTTDFTNLTFWIHGGAGGGQQLQVQALLDGQSQAAVSLAALAANTWQPMTVSLASLGVARQPNCAGFWIQDRVGAAQPAFYLDDLALEGAAPAPPATNAPVAITVDVLANRHPISPYIYGVAFASVEQLAALNSPLNRSGGNAETRYNWQLNAHNHACMDNEHSIWHSTHRDVHPQGATMREIRDTFFDYAQKVKAIDPGARLCAPEEWGWMGYFWSGADQQWAGAHLDYSQGHYPDRQANGGWDYLPWLLAQASQRAAATGQRWLDVLTVPYYPQGGEFSDDASTAKQLLRNRSTRSLWDPGYADTSWINSVVKLIPRLRNWVAAYYPGTRIGITEYNWGAEKHISGATAQADVLGISRPTRLPIWTMPPFSGAPSAAHCPRRASPCLYWRPKRNRAGDSSPWARVASAISGWMAKPVNVSPFWPAPI